MLRYLRLYAAFVRFSVSRALEFRFDFFFRIAMDLFYYAVNIAFYRVLFLHTGAIGGWNEADAMVFVAGFLFLDALNMTVFTNNLWWLPQLINKGDLDYYLVRPVSTLFFVSLRDFAANSFVNLLFAAGILVWAIASHPGELGAARVAAFLAALLVGNFLYFCMRLLTLLPVFWTQAPRGFDHVFWNVSRVLERPDRIFRGWARRIFVSVLPFSLIASFPARLALDGFDAGIVAHLLGVTAIFFGIVLLVWRAGLRAYGSASS